MEFNKKSNNSPLPLFNVLFTKNKAKPKQRRMRLKLDTFHILYDAIHAVRQRKLSCNTASKLYNITYGTLYRHIEIYNEHLARHGIIETTTFPYLTGQHSHILDENSSENDHGENDIELETESNENKFEETFTNGKSKSPFKKTDKIDMLQFMKSEKQPDIESDGDLMQDLFPLPFFEHDLLPAKNLVKATPTEHPTGLPFFTGKKQKRCFACKIYFQHTADLIKHLSQHFRVPQMNRFNSEKENQNLTLSENQKRSKNMPYPSKRYPIATTNFNRRGVMKNTIRTPPALYPISNKSRPPIQNLQTDIEQPQDKRNEEKTRNKEYENFKNFARILQSRGVTIIPQTVEIGTNKIIQEGKICFDEKKTNSNLNRGPSVAAKSDYDNSSVITDSSSDCRVEHLLPGFPIIQLNNRETLQKLATLGITKYLPVSSITKNALYGLPILSAQGAVSLNIYNVRVLDVVPLKPTDKTHTPTE